MLIPLKKKVVMWIVLTIIVLLTSLNYILSSVLSGIPVLNYHQINNEAHNALTLSSQEFDAQMEYLYNNGYTTISPNQLVDYLQYGTELPPNPVLITFDDGYVDNYNVAYPILQKYNLKATIFVITDFVGNNGRYLSWKQVREMHNNGFNFQSHTLSHMLLANVSDEEVLSQLIKSREGIEWRLKEKVEYLAYPGGAYDPRTIELAKQAGYRAAFTINLGRDTKNCGLFTLNRIPIFQTSHSLLHFKLRLKFTQALLAMQEIKSLLNQFGASKIANWIYIP